VRSSRGGHVAGPRSARELRQRAEGDPHKYNQFHPTSIRSSCRSCSICSSAMSMRFDRIRKRVFSVCTGGHVAGLCSSRELRKRAKGNTNLYIPRACGLDHGCEASQ